MLVVFRQLGYCLVDNTLLLRLKVILSLQYNWLKLKHYQKETTMVVFLHLVRLPDESNQNRPQTTAIVALGLQDILQTLHIVKALLHE